MNWKTEDYPLNEVSKMKLILKRTYELAFDLAIRSGISDVNEAQDEAWMKVAGSVLLIIKNK